MRLQSCLLVMLFALASIQANSQTRIQVKRDTVVITNGELKINNASKNVNGYLYNTGNGLTKFQPLTPSVDSVWGSGDTLYYKKGVVTGYTRLNAAGTGGAGGATNGAVFFAGTGGTTRYHSNFYYDSVLQRLGVGTAAPAAALHALSTAEQLRIGYDTSNYTKFTVGSDGKVQLDAVGTSPAFIFLDAIQTATITTSSNLWVTSASGGANTSGPQWQFGGSTNIAQRFSAGRGASSVTVPAGYNYSGVNFPDQLFTESSSGTHRIVANTVVGGLTGSNQGAATKYMTSLYIKKPQASSNAVVPDSAAYSFWAEVAPRIDVGNDATGDLLYRSTNGALTRIGIGAENQVLGISAGVPAWVAATGQSAQYLDTLWRSADTLYYRKGGNNGYALLPAPGLAIGSPMGGAGKGSILYTGTGGTLQQSNSALYFDSTQQRLGIGTTAPAAKTHAIATTEQLRLGYDTANYVAFTVSSVGSLVIDNVTSSGTAQAVQIADILHASGGIKTGTAQANGNLTVSPTSVYTTTDGNWLFGGASSLNYRVGSKGSGNPVLAANNSYSGWILARNPVTAATSGTHAVITNLGILPPAITTGAATITNAATVYIDNAPTGGTNNWALLVNGGASKFGGDIKLANTGNGIYIKEGTDAVMGVATLVSGTVTVNTSKVTANSRIFLTINGGSLANVGTTYISARTAGTSFTITSTNGQDASDVAWLIVEPN